MTKEEIYDLYISPLINRVFDICEEHKIAMLANFELDEDKENNEILAVITQTVNEKGQYGKGHALAARIIEENPIVISSKKGD